MNTPMETARRVADAVLYEGYLLYPYRASAAKNRTRWQFGVLVPPGYTATAEPSACQTECLLEAADDATLHVRLRFLQILSRSVERVHGGGYRRTPALEVGGHTHLTYDEAVERERDALLSLAGLLEAEQVVDVGFPATRVTEPLADPSGEPAGRVVREHRRLEAVMRLRAERLAGPYGLVRLRVRVENTSGWRPGPDASRDDALRRSPIAAHTLLAVTEGAFLSLLDPPEWAREAAESCGNLHTWPVLVGEEGRRDAMLSAPIILYDHPSIAPESPGDFFDATEIDELLSLRTLTLTEEERREAAATDPRAAEIMERTAGMPPELLERLHGAVRYLRREEGARPPDPERSHDTPWWDPGADTSVSPETDGVVVAGVTVARGSRVRLLPGGAALPGTPSRTASHGRRADAHDMFLAGRTATVEAVLLDVDGVHHLAVTLADDPSADLQRAQGRFLYFSPDEVEPLGDAPADRGSGG
ncbi:hypothetical protein [Streptosporangium carneum]|uniref:Uncharacterized protein n=1 Tax=Streptosporangium carneum TaxID=47481 RepID=A0A9W6I9Y4_9ACTN|nr:hypothetical protein [Streptosporangium carneum]GLK13844.1 hypothetical protein GCM10017600_72550 [Streptosporangium carneum]